MSSEFHDLVLAARRSCQQWKWSETLVAQGRAQELMRPLIQAGSPEGQATQVAYAELIDELAEAVQEVVQTGSAYPVEPALKAELCWQVSLALQERQLLPPPRRTGWPQWSA